MKLNGQVTAAADRPLCNELRAHRKACRRGSGGRNSERRVVSGKRGTFRITVRSTLCCMMARFFCCAMLCARARVFMRTRLARRNSTNMFVHLLRTASLKGAATELSQGSTWKRPPADRWSESVYRISLTQIKIDIPREGGRVGHHNHARYQWTDMRASAAFGSRLARRE